MNFDLCGDQSGLALPLSIHHRLASILIRQSLKISESEKKQSLFGRTQDQFGFNKEKMKHFTFLHVTMSRLVLHPLLRTDWARIELADAERITIDSVSNPLLGPAILNKDQNAASSYLMCLLLDEREVTLPERVERLFNAGRLCARRSDSLILSVRIVEIALKLSYRQFQRGMRDEVVAHAISTFIQLVAKEGKELLRDLISSLCDQLDNFDQLIIYILLSEPGWTNSASCYFLDIALQSLFLKGKDDPTYIDTVAPHFR